jgi:hypothetical protein
LTALRHKSRIIAVIVIWLVVTAPIMFAMMSIQENNFDDIGIEFVGTDGKKTILLKPEKWVGKDLPLIRYLKPKNEDIDIVSNLNSGVWTIILYRSNCPKCKRILSNIAVKQIKNIVYVEVSLNGKTETGKTSTDYDMQLDNEYDWFCQPPIVVQIDNKIVTSVYTSEEQIDSFLISVQH